MTDTTERGIVTPEAVRLEFEDAGVGSRAVAIAIDWAIQGATLLFAGIAAGFVLDRAGGGLPPWVVTTIIVLLSFIVLFGYPVAFETLMRGRTPGKAALGLRVVTIEGAPVSFRHAALRAALGLVDFAITSGFLAVITVLASRRSQRVGDHVAGTVVVRERTGARPAAATPFVVPRGLDSYASTIDTTGLRREDYLAIREFLLRADTLPADRRSAIGARLANGVAARVAHRPPAEVAPETFLRVVAARYQARGAGSRAASASPAEWPQAAAPRAGADVETRSTVRSVPAPPALRGASATPAAAAGGEPRASQEDGSDESGQTNRGFVAPD